MSSGPISAPGFATAPPVPGGAPAPSASAPDMGSGVNSVSAVAPEMADAQLSFAAVEDPDLSDGMAIDFALNMDDQIDLSMMDTQDLSEVDLGPEPPTDMGEMAGAEGMSDQSDMSITAAVLEEANSDMAMMAANEQIQM